MKLLFVDTETNGLPADYNAPPTALDNWPKIVSIAWIAYTDRKLTSAGEFILKPDDFEIEASASAIHGITQERAERKGLNRKTVFIDFACAVFCADLIVGHNLAFDRNVIEAEFIRHELNPRFCTRAQIDTMTETVDFVGIAGKFGKCKWPKLAELHQKLFGEDFENAHSALADIEATARCFWALIDHPDIAKISPAIARLAL